MMSRRSIEVTLGIIVSFLLFNLMSAQAQIARDPGPRSGTAGVGDPPRPLDGLTAGQRALFDAGAVEFAQKEIVKDGLGPTMNLDSCGGCHAQPALGGTSPDNNPQFLFWSDFLQNTNRLPSGEIIGVPAAGANVTNDMPAGGRMDERTTAVLKLEGRIMSAATAARAIRRARNGVFMGASSDAFLRLGRKAKPRMLNGF